MNINTEQVQWNGMKKNFKEKKMDEFADISQKWNRFKWTE